MEKTFESNLNNTGLVTIEFLSFSKKINENEITKFLENKGISFKDIKFIDFEDDYSNNNLNKFFLI